MNLTGPNEPDSQLGYLQLPNAVWIGFADLEDSGPACAVLSGWERGPDAQNSKPRPFS